MGWKIKGKGRIRQRAGTMNKVEAEYGLILEYRKREGDILWYEYEGEKFRLADRDFYTPDFNVMLADGTIEHHEVKTTWSKGQVGITEDAKEKLKQAAEKFPYRFLLVVKTPTGWTEREM